MKRGFVLFLCMLWIGNVFALDSLRLNEMKRIAEALQMPAVKKGDLRITFPEVPAEYRLELKGSSRLPVVDRQGNIGKVLTDKEARLYFVLTDRETGETLDVSHLSVVVPGEKTEDEKGNACPFVVPALQEWQGKTGTFTLRNGCSVVIRPEDGPVLERTASILAEDLYTMFGLKCKVRTGVPEQGDIYLTLNSPDRQLGEEGYRMSVGKHIRIEGVMPKGVFWGTRTLLQMADQGSLQLPQGEIRDYPEYARRGFMLDVARKFFRMDFLQEYIRIMAYYKMNEFHIHLNDNGFVQFFDNDWEKTYAAFRLECETYPGLTAKDGFYTKKAFRDLQLGAMEYGVNVLPEIDIPAHSLAFTHYRKSLGSKKYGMDHLDLSNPEIYPFFDSLLAEYLGGPEPVFAGPEVHIGTDEYAKEEAESFRKFTDYYLKYVQSFGKRARLWGALTHAQGTTPVTSEGVIMNAWYNGYADPKEMMRQGYDLISTPDGWLYIVPAAGYYYDYLDLERIYKEWEPVMVGNQVFPQGHPQILGGTFAVWNDHCGNGITEKDVHYRAFPAMQVLAQKMWSGKGRETYDNFASKAFLVREAPGVNLRGIVETQGNVVLKYSLTHPDGKDESGNGYQWVAVKGGKQMNPSDGFTLNGKSCLKTPLKEIGYGYTVEFEIRPESGNEGKAVLFKSPDATVVYTEDGCLGFERDGYFYRFDQVLKPGEWYKVAISGDAKGTALYVDGKPVQRLEGQKRVVKDAKGRESTMYIQQTLVFPLQQLGDMRRGFKGNIKNLTVYNQEIYR